MDAHPYIVHFPIALIILSFFYQCLTVFMPSRLPTQLTLWALVPGVLATIPAVLTGEKAEESLTDIPEEIHDLIETHELFANITTWGGITLVCVWLFLVMKKVDNKQVQLLLFAFLGLLFASVCTTGYIGGQLVHIHDI